MQTSSTTYTTNAWFVALLAILASLASSASAQEPYVIPCDGSDVHSRLQAAANSAADTYILLTAGACLITETVLITNREGVRIEGEGWNRTVLVWQGVDGDEGPMFSVQNSSGISFAHFGTSNAPDEGEQTYDLVSAFDVYNACFDGYDEIYEGFQYNTCDFYQPGSGPGSHGNSFENLRIGACHDECTDCCRDTNANELDYAIRIRLHPDYDETSGDECGASVEADCDNGGHTFTNLHVRHFRQSAYVIEGKNSNGNVFTACHGGGRFNYDDPMPADPAEIWGESFVRTGREEVDGNPALPAGSFSWYGGSANSVNNAVFVIGPNPDKIHIQGLYDERCGMLLRTYESGLATSGGVTIESVRFDTTHMPEWFADGNPYGLVVDMRSSRSLNMRGNLIGERGMQAWNEDDLVFEDAEPENASICWSFPEDEEESDAASFVFVGNAIGTDNANPFHPTDGSQHMDECIYPTTQHSNLIATGWENVDAWTPMPQHFSTLDTSQSDTFSVIRRPTSHTYFNVTGGGTLRCLEDGVSGQKAVLIGHGAEIASFGACHAFFLKDGATATLDEGHTITLVRGDYFWYETSRNF